MKFFNSVLTFTAITVGVSIALAQQGYWTTTEQTGVSETGSVKDVAKVRASSETKVNRPGDLPARPEPNEPKVVPVVAPKAQQPVAAAVAVDTAVEPDPYTPEAAVEQYRSESRDSEWADSLELRLQDLADANAEIPPLQFQEIDCRTSVCVSVLVVKDMMDVDRLPLALAHLDVSGYMLANATPDPGERLQVIINR